MDRIERDVLINASRQRVWDALISAGHGTGRAIVESGFTRLDLPPEEQERYAAGNVGGWGRELDELREHLEK